MKIVIISAAFPLRGGIAHSAGLLYKELKKENDVEVITFSRQYPKLFFPGTSQTEVEDQSNIIPTNVILDSINPFNWLKVSRLIISSNPDLVIFKHWMPFFAPCYGFIAKKLKKKKIKLLAVCHNIIPHEKRTGDIILSKYFLRKMDYFVLLSDQVKRDLETIIKQSKNKVLPLPIFSIFGETVSKESARKKLKLTDGKIILFFGFIRDYKGLDTLIESLAIVKKKMDVTLIVAGEFYSDEQKYISLIEKLNLQTSVIIKKDFIPTMDVKYYFSAADVVVLPYKSATQSGIVQVAVNFEKPVIATNVGGLSEVIENGKSGFIVEKENPDKFANAIIRFYDENRENEFSANMKSLKEKYSWQNFVKGIFELIKSKP